MPAEYVKIDDLRKLERDLKQSNKDLASRLRRTIKGAATTVAEKAKEIAESEGLHDSGALIGSIKAGMQGGAGVVRVTAERNGFRYPAVYEYGRRSPWQDSKGVRTFLAPALDAKRVEIEAEVLADIDWIIQELARRG